MYEIKEGPVMIEISKVLTLMETLNIIPCLTYEQRWLILEDNMKDLFNKFLEECKCTKE